MASSLATPPVSSLRWTLQLGIPATLGMLSQWVMGIADIKMVGRLEIGATAERGAQAIANVHVANVYILALLITFNALAIGIHAICARRWGEGDSAAAVRTMSTGLAVALVLGAMLLPLYQLLADWAVHLFLQGHEAVDAEAVASYLRIRFWAIPALLALFAMRGWFNGAGKTGVVLASVLVVNGANIALNWGWIEGHWGFARLEENGAALASAVATGIGFAFLVVHSLTAPSCRAIGLLRHFAVDMALARRIVTISIPSFIHHGAAHTGFLIFHAMIIPRTREGTAAVAASGIVWSTASLCFFISLGFGVAAATMMGQSLGAGDLRRASRCVWTACWVGYGGTLIVAVVLVVFGRAIALRFNSDPAVADLAWWLFLIVASFQLLDNFGIILCEAFKGAGMTMFAMIVEVPMNLILFLGLSWWWGIWLDWGAVGAWVPFVIYASLLATIMIVAFRAGLWRRGRA